MRVCFRRGAVYACVCVCMSVSVVECMLVYVCACLYVGLCMCVNVGLCIFCVSKEWVACLILLRDRDQTHYFEVT